jgi:hypothetical protein
MFFWMQDLCNTIKNRHYRREKSQWIIPAPACFLLVAIKSKSIDTLQLT